MRKHQKKFLNKTLGKCTFYFGESKLYPYFEVIPRIFPFSFSPKATNTYGNNYFNSNLPVSERWRMPWPKQISFYSSTEPAFTFSKSPMEHQMNV